MCCTFYFVLRTVNSTIRLSAKFHLTLQFVIIILQFYFNLMINVDDE
ncbi:MAG: hypothetical protein H6Q17_698 [Bacteroidetes bacterium]|nr:hypothetical protein [Bacteroidota bacterium]